MSAELALLAVAVLVIAFLYASVGHAGASGYIAVLSLAGLAPDVIKPTALVLNILVATLATLQFARAGHFSWSLFWPFALLSVPLAFVGGYLVLPTQLFQVLVGAVLLFSAARFLVRPPPEVPGTPPSRPVAIAIGGALGLLAGLTGTGGGIFLTPLMLFLRFARAKTASAVSACFILVNSLAGLGRELQQHAERSVALARAGGRRAGGRRDGVAARQPPTLTSSGSSGCSRWCSRSRGRSSSSRAETRLNPAAGAAPTRGGSWPRSRAGSRARRAAPRCDARLR